MDNTSIYLLLVNSLEDTGELPAGFCLPHEEDQQIPFADGAQDGIYMYHMMHSPISGEEADELGSILQMGIEGREDEAEEGLFRFCQENRAISIIDEVQKYVADHTSQDDIERVYRFAVDMVVGSEHAECVKIGMIILELFDTERNEILADIIKVMGTSNEFTLFSVIIMRHWSNGAMAILELAKHVHEWGRIHCMDFIEPENDEIKAWILENGVDNGVMPAYSGMTAFEKANVLEVLSRKNTSEKEMSGVLKIVSAMLDEGPVSGISNLEDPAGFLVDVVEKAMSMLPLEVSDYEIIREIDLWQEGGDNTELDLTLREFFADDIVRQQIAEAVREGKAQNLAEAYKI